MLKFETTYYINFARSLNFVLCLKFAYSYHLYIIISLANSNLTIKTLANILTREKNN